ncbi:MAG: AAA family ATPase [Magnetococcales bacterium]|nr:AAA family ATPase [Magnetococcales bacterium]
MYQKAFGLHRHPFRNTPNVDLFYSGARRGPILDALSYAILNGEGIIKVVGEVGSGKTMLCRMLAHTLPDHVETVFLLNPSLSGDEVLDAIAEELHDPFPHEEDLSRQRKLSLLHTLLVERFRKGVRVVVLVEEAQNMPLEALEQVRMLSNLETHTHKLLQLVLFGQPELDTTLKRQDIRQLKERIAYSFSLAPLTLEETGDYLTFRLQAAGHDGSPLFEPGAIRLLWKISCGLTRRINSLADKSLLIAHTRESQRITARHVLDAAKDSDYPIPGFTKFISLMSDNLGRLLSPFAQLTPGAAAFLAMVATGTFFWLFLQPSGVPETPTTPNPTHQQGSTPTETSSTTHITDSPSGDTPSSLESSTPSTLKRTQPPKSEPVRTAESRPARTPTASPTVQHYSPDVPTPKPRYARIIQPTTAATTSEGSEQPSTGRSERPSTTHATPPISSTLSPLSHMEQRMRAVRNWIATSGKQDYTIQFLTLDNSRLPWLEEFLTEQSSHVDDIYIKELKPKDGPTRFLLFHGRYSSFQEAENALNDLPPALSNGGPYVRSLNHLARLWYGENRPQPATPSASATAP